MADFQAPGQYDRIVSIEMFEHMKNYQVGQEGETSPFLSQARA
jgi:cyclopropane fatty-acyl-phospholipid synthase-like methyltransferase